MAKIIHNDTVDVLLERVSIRAFKDEAIEPDVLNTIEQTAQNTASSQYLNDWSVIRIKNPAVKSEIARICNQDYIANAPVLYIFVLDQYRNSLIAQSEGVAADSDEFTLKNSYRFSQAQNDAVLALHAMETAAESFELGTVILGSILGNIPELVKLLALPKYTYPVLGLALGKPDQHPDPKPRLQLCLGYEICEDIWSPDPPSIHLALAGATIICNGSASNASLEKDLYRRSLISGQSARLLCCYAYCSSGQGDSTGDVTVGGQEIIAENGSILAQAEPFGDGFAIADVDVESLWGARRGMSSFHVEPTPQYADYHETMFDMTIPDHPLMRPVSKQPFIPADEKMRADCCSLAVTMQAHGLAARVGAQNADHLVIDTTNSSVANTALAMLAVARFYDLERPAVPDMYVAVSQDAQNRQSANVKLIEQLADALGLPLATLASARAAQQNATQGSPEHPVLDIQELIGDTSWLIVNPSDMTQLALGLTQFPFDLGRQYGINSQIAHTFVPVILRQYVQECADGNLQTLLGAICDADNELHIPEHDTVSMSESAELGPAVVEDFYLDGFLRAQYRPAKTFALAKQAFAGEYGEHELLVWMKAFYARFFGSQFLRHSLPDGPRIGSAGLDLRDGFMMPTYAQSTLWMNEVDALLNAAAK